jgi:hypothetical protein
MPDVESEHGLRCVTCDRAVSVRWFVDGEPVFWTCEVHGIRDQSEVIGEN